MSQGSETNTLLTALQTSTPNPLHVCLGTKPIDILHLKLLPNFGIADQSIQPSQQTPPRSSRNAISHGARQQYLEHDNSANSQPPDF